MHIETSLEVIAAAAVEKETENERFREHLQAQDAAVVDRVVHAINREVEPQISCVDCGNCCKSLMVNLTEEDCVRLAPELDMTLPDFKEKYVEQGFSGNLILNSVPCHFLDGTRCSIYEHRFYDCRDFPGIHREHFVGRTFSMLMHYGRCPIIYNVWEQLKTATGFVAAG